MTVRVFLNGEELQSFDAIEYESRRELPRLAMVLSDRRESIARAANLAILSRSFHDRMDELHARPQPVSLDEFAAALCPVPMNRAAKRKARRR